jgi:hypothetical protein
MNGQDVYKGNPPGSQVKGEITAMCFCLVLPLLIAYDLGANTLTFFSQFPGGKTNICQDRLGTDIYGKPETLPFAQRLRAHGVTS